MKNQSLSFKLFATDAAKRIDRNWKKLLPIFKETAREVLRSEFKEVHKFSLTVILESDEELRELNVRALDHDYYTDIITFEIDREEHVIEAELYISIERARENALRFKASNRNELARLVIHGMLHLAGYGDKLAADKKRMRRKERYFLELISKTVSIE